MKSKMSVTKKELLIMAGILWVFAGSMVMKVGIESYFNLNVHALYYTPIIIGVFLLFYFEVFSKLVSKNFKRIGGLKDEERKIYSFMDKKSYLIMAVMMTSGILIRKELHLPMLFFFTFYTGLGAALFTAGVSEVCKIRLEV